MPRGLRRFQESGQSHFVTFSCYRRQPHFETPEVFDLFVHCLEDMRCRFELCVYGYVVMPEHVHLLLSEPLLEFSLSNCRHRNFQTFTSFPDGMTKEFAFRGMNQRVRPENFRKRRQRAT
jgi:REP element-mobilizing transposase RayT